MKNFTVQCFAVMMATLVLVIAMPKKHDLDVLKKLIHNESQQLLSNPKVEIIRVPYNRGANECPHEFSCVAQKALKFAHWNETMKLCRLLNQYNSQTNNTNCAVNQTEHKLKRLLRDIVGCF